MTTKAPQDVIERAETWPDEAQAELAAIAREIDASVRGGVYQPTREQLEGMNSRRFSPRRDGMP